MFVVWWESGCVNPTLLFDFLSRWIHEFCSSLLLQVPSQKLAYDRKGNIDGDGWHFRKQKTSAEENDGGDDRVDGHNPLQ